MLYTRALYLHLAICASLSRHFYHLMNQKSLRYPTFGYFEETNLNQLKFNSVKPCSLHNCLLIKCIFMICLFLLIWFIFIFDFFRYALASRVSVRTGSYAPVCIWGGTFYTINKYSITEHYSDKQFPQVGFFSDYAGRKYTDLNLG